MAINQGESAQIFVNLEYIKATHHEKFHFTRPYANGQLAN
jgi:hypothetical protein